MDGDRAHKSLLHTKYLETLPMISPCGRWLAYFSDETGENQVFVRPFPEVDKGGRWQISTNGGIFPLWSPDGRELFYIKDDAVVVVPVKTEKSFSHGAPKILFRGRNFGNIVADGCPWDISPKDKRFLIIKPPASAGDKTAAEAPRRINIVLNWFEELKERVPTDSFSVTSLQNAKKFYKLYDI